MKYDNALLYNKLRKKLFVFVTSVIFVSVFMYQSTGHKVFAICKLANLKMVDGGETIYDKAIKSDSEYLKTIFKKNSSVALNKENKALIGIEGTVVTVRKNKLTINISNSSENSLKEHLINITVEGHMPVLDKNDIIAANVKKQSVGYVSNDIYKRINGIYYDFNNNKCSIPDFAYEIISRPFMVKGDITDVDTELKWLNVKINKIFHNAGPVDSPYKLYENIKLKILIPYGGKLSDKEKNSMRKFLRKGKDIIVTCSQYNNVLTNKKCLGVFPSDIYYIDNGKFYDVNNKEEKIENVDSISKQ
ncbi:hypothetical protein CLTEP_21490 [Clostridium tepidiprofundi DSM 19306]|uniref:Uncharacterized protein n=1 Tax=Clostridium tepidiprofundi DSM 19306 TaxID=1121338 RepID=A0A151B059_9CLOT|nr:hypothetical protein [Clostridium tepidiprofundi]KYH33291.1 hypothetical protein CLTEP_21490 [Clostridium tepidiprofundi DSM 19306]